MCSLLSFPGAHGDIIKLFQALHPDNLISRTILEINLMECCSFTVLRCQVLSAPNNGKLSNTVCGNQFGSVCRFACNGGFKIIGSTVRKCVKTGRNVTLWDGSTTFCEGLCLQNQYQYNVLIIRTHLFALIHKREITKRIPYFRPEMSKIVYRVTGKVLQ